MPTMTEKAATLYRDLAHKYVTVAIRHGDLPKLDGSIQCTDCKAPAVEYDHRDYLKPLKVDPVCMACNQYRGPGRNRGPNPKNKPVGLKKRFDALGQLPKDVKQGKRRPSKWKEETIWKRDPTT